MGFLMKHVGVGQEVDLRAALAHLRAAHVQGRRAQDEVR